MSENTEPNPSNPEPEAAPRPETDWKAEADKWKAMARKHEDLWTAAKELQGLKREEILSIVEKSKKFDDLQESSKSDLERAQAAKDTADKEASFARAELIRLRVANRKGLSESQAKRLVGTTEDELEADADELLATFKSQEEPDRGLNRRPQERLRSGASPDKEPEPNPKDIVDKVMADSRF